MLIAEALMTIEAKSMLFEMTCTYNLPLAAFS
jgi:hypothetical protein